MSGRPPSSMMPLFTALTLIALATHGRGGLKRLVLGSVADKVLRGADTAVLVYRPVEEPAPAER